MNSLNRADKPSGIFTMDKSSWEKRQAAFQRANTIINMLLVSHTPKIILIAGTLGVLFLAYYSLVATPSNFDSISDTFWYFIPALAMLLSIAVIFNNFILSSETKSMPSDIQSVINQIQQIRKLLEPVNNYVTNEASMSSTIALYYLILATTNAAKEEEKKDTNHLQAIYADFIHTSDYIIQLFQRTNNQFALITMPTANFIIRTMVILYNLKVPKDEDLPKFLQILLKLHAAKSLLARIYIRHSVTTLSNDMLISVVPTMSLIAALSSFSTFSDAGLFRILFSAALSVVFLPFVLLLVRVVPIVHLMRNNSSLPFPYN